MSDNLQVQALFPYQQVDKERPEQFKIKRWGRRTGKTRDMLHCATVGHGPRQANGERLFRGLAHGKNVLWVGPDYTQLNNVWREEIFPRFNGAKGCGTNENEMTAYVGDARLIMRTAKPENHKAMRGLGKDLAGVIVDEGAWMDLELLMTNVLLPLTLDEDAWMQFGSTPNGGSDGHVDEEGSRRTPSYFNVLCEQQLTGKMPGWWQSHHDARSNPTIKKAAFDRLVKQYENQPLKLRQEVYAELLRGGAGKAFGELGAMHQLLKSPAEVRDAFGVCDWGWSQHGYLGLLAQHARGCHLEHEFPFNGPIPDKDRIDPELAGFRCGQEWLRALAAKEITRLPDLVYCDSQMDAVTQGGLSQMQMLQAGFQRALDDQAPACVVASKGQGSRAVRKSVLHMMLRHRTIMSEDGQQVVMEWPRFTMSPRCTFAFRTIGALMVDPKHPEDVDTTGPDHAYDAITYGMVMTFPDIVTQATHIPDPRKQSDPLSVHADQDFENAIAPLIGRKKRPSQKVYG